MGHFEDLEDLGLKTSVSVLGIRPGPRSELKTLDRLVDMYCIFLDLNGVTPEQLTFQYSK